MANITTRVTTNSVAGAGTITTSTSSVIVTGSGTAFTTAVTIGQLLYTTGGTLIGTVLTIDSATQITLTANAAVALSAQPYNIVSTGISTKGAPLTNTEIDQNFINLNNAVVAGANAVVTNNANTIVKRGPSGEFSAGAITAGAGTSVGGTTVPSSNATQAQMEAGTDTTTRFMTAERVKQAIDVLGLKAVGVATNDLTGFENRTSSSLFFDESSRIFQLIPSGTCNVWKNGTKYTLSGTVSLTLESVSAGTGTITSSTSSATVTGTNTSFTTQVNPGMVLKTTSGLNIGTVQTVNSNTQITLTGNAATSYTNIAYNISSAPAGGGRYIVYDPVAGTLSDVGDNPANALSGIVVAYIYYDSINSKALIVGDERHSYTRDTTWHLAQHNNSGAIWRSGGVMTYTLDNDSSQTFALTSPLVFVDEDIEHTITHNASPNNNMTQVLTGAASLPTLYLNGSRFVQSANSTTPWIYGASTARYNQIIGGNGQLTDAPSGTYINYWIIATNDAWKPVKAVMGRNYYNSVQEAAAEEFVDYGLPFPELVPLYHITLLTNSAYALPSRVRIVNVRTLQQRRAQGSASIVQTSHSSLASLTNDDHPQYVHISNPRTITAEHTFTNNITMSGTGYLKLPSGTTAERPASPVNGMIRYNTTLGFMEQYASGSWNTIAPPPTIANVTPTSYNGESGTLFTINGSNFDTGANVKFITNSGVEYNPGVLTRISGSQLTATTPQDFTVADEPLKIKVINGSGLSFQLDNAIDCGSTPTWQTAAGTVATIYDKNGSYFPITTLSATDPDAGSSITYSIVAGSLPSGCSLNSSNGQISGDPGDSSSSYTSTFTVRATDNAGNTADRQFSIVVNPYQDGSEAGRAATSAQAIKTLTGTNTDGVYYINLPTAGPTPLYCIMNNAMSGGGWMMMMKGSRTGTFGWSASYWTSVNTFNDNTSYTNRSDQEAKWNAMNYFQMKDIMALWPDLANGGDVSGQGYGTVWIENNCYGGNRITPINFFNTVNNYNPNGLGVRNAKWNGGSQFSSQSGAQFYGFNFTANSGNAVRWGFAWNNEGDWGSNDVSGGIGMNRTGWTAGDYIGCCQDVGGFNRSARIELYCR